MRKKLYGCLTPVSSLFISAFCVQVMGAKSDTPAARSYCLVHQLVTRWHEAYQHLDADAMASLENDSFTLVDRFGELHRAFEKRKQAQIWNDGFEAIDRQRFTPTFEIRSLQFPVPDVARVQVCTYYEEGIGLLDGSRISPLWQAESFVVVKIRGTWRITSLDVHDQSAPEGFAKRISPSP